MLRDIFKELEKSSVFEIPILDNLIEIRGRVLAPSEIERSSLTNSLVLQSIQQAGGLDEFKNLQEELKDDPEDKVVEKAFRMLNRIRPEHLAKMNQSQDQLIAQCVTHAKKVDGGDWEKIHIVLRQEEQNADRNTLWIGMIPKEDRAEILNRALNGHKEAVERLSVFR